MIRVVVLSAGSFVVSCVGRRGGFGFFGIEAVVFFLVSVF